MGNTKPKRVPGGSFQLPARKAVPPRAALPSPKFIPADNGGLIVRWSKFDYEGPWCLGRSTSDVIVDLMKRLRDIERMRIDEVFAPWSDIGKEYGPPAGLPNTDAGKRLIDLGLDDETQVSRLRITGERRLYGVRRDREFYPVFWDPHHEIWPSQKKHT